MLFLMQPSAIENGPYDYTRSGNPTRDALERFDHDVNDLCFVLQLWMFHIMFFCLFFSLSLILFLSPYFF